MERLRVAIYSHDSFGLGHLTRSSRLAHSIVEALPQSSVLILTGSPAAHRLDYPRGVDYVKLPSVVKRGPEDYPARQLRVSRQHVRRIRGQILSNTVTTFDPHLLMVDNLPLGMKGEMAPILETLAAQRSRPRIHLNLRDVLDEPEVIREHWQEQRIYEAIDRIYDAVHVFGDASCFDAQKAYKLPADRTVHLGYVGPWSSEMQGGTPLPPMDPARDYRILVTIGGGGDGDAILHHVAHLQRDLGDSTPFHFDVVTGPLMEADTRSQVSEQLAELPSITLHEYVDHLPGWMRQSDLVLSMAGYNTMCEVMACAKRSVVIPRVKPRREQVIRANALEARGLVQVLHPDQLTTPRLARALTSAFSSNPPRRPPELNGTRDFGQRIRQLFTQNKTNGSKPASALAGKVAGIFFIALIGVLLDSPVAHADLVPNELEAFLSAGYDSNVLNASDAELRAFDQADPGAFFVVTSTRDAVLAGGLTAAWRLGRPFGKKTKLRAGYKRTEFLENSIKSQDYFAIDVSSRVARGSRVTLGVEYQPQIYGRHRRDKQAGPGEPMFRAEVQRRVDLELDWRQTTGPTSELRAEIGGVWKRYDQPFEERDEVRLNLGAEITRRFTQLAFSLGGGFRRANTQNDPSRPDDRSYRKWLVEPTVSFDKLGPLEELSLAFEVGRRRYLSDNPEDDSHFHRVDWERRASLAALRQLSPSWRLAFALEQGWRSVRTSRSVAIDEEGASSEGTITTGLLWRFAP